jgi:hypothetical protein
VKALKTLTAIFTVCFLFGFGLVMMSPMAVTAGPSPCDGFCGSQIHCESDPSCGFNEQMHVKCKLWYPAPIFCDGPWTCGCVDLGCGELCEPT